MYLLILPLPLFLFILLFHRRKKKIIQKVCGMCMEEKCAVINDLIRPFGFSYVASRDIFTSRIDAWQRKFGYCTLYDETAYRFHLILDALPVYFDYNGKTWLIELWKGQYGINTGCEIGIYQADRILQENERTSTLFRSISDEELLPLSLHLFRSGREIACRHARHWWLTAFSLGRYSENSDLYMRADITLPNHSMTNAFVRGLTEAGCCPDDICVSCNTVTISFPYHPKASVIPTTKNILRTLRIKMAQRMNRIWCSLYLFLTRPFCLSLDKLLYLYYYLPFLFRKTLYIRRYKKNKGRRS